MVVRVYNKSEMDVYVASCVEAGGIYHYKMSAGELHFVDCTKLDKPMYMVVEKRKMYIVLRAPFKDNESGVIIYDIDENGSLINPSEIISTRGEVACHIAVHEGNIYCANYISGSAILLPDTLVQHRGVGIHPQRQEGPHVHYVGLTPDKKFICVTDLGLDTIFVYQLDMTLHTSVKVPEGHGVRHLVFSEDGKYLFAANELRSTVAAFRYDNGEFTFLDYCSCLPETYSGESTASAIRIQDGLIYVSNRGHDSVAILQFQDEKLELIRCISSGGRTPRDFEITEKFLMCANQNSDTVTVINMNSEDAMTSIVDIKMPICICLADHKGGKE